MTHYSVIGFLLLLFGFTTLSSSASESAYREFELSADQKASIESSVQAILNLPTTAQFDQIAATTNEDGEVSVCGLVISQGSAEVKTFVGFLATDAEGRFDALGVATNATEQRAMISVCGMKRIQLDVPGSALQ